MDVVDGTTSGRLRAARELLEEYGRSVGFDLSFQDFDGELQDLPGEYAPPTGRLLLAYAGGELAGCVGVRGFEAGVAELKRLYVRPEYRGTGVGRRLTEAAIAGAREAGYERIRLDTLPSMDAARGLYRSLGFVEVDAYRFNPAHGTTYFELDLHG